MSAKRTTDKLILTVGEASLHIESDPHALMNASLPPSGGQCLVRGYSEVARIQAEMNRVRGKLARIRVE